MESSDSTAQAAASEKATNGQLERRGGIGLGAWFAIICWPLVVATALYVYQGKRMADLAPDVLVVDDIALIKLAMDNGADRESPDSIRAEVDRIVRANGLDNSILLSRSMILYAPTRNQVSVSVRRDPMSPAEQPRTLK